VTEWFKNSNKGESRSINLLKIKPENVKSAPQLYINSLEDFNTEFKVWREGQPMQENMKIYANLKTEKWNALSPEEQAIWESCAQDKHAELTHGPPEDLKAVCVILPYLASHLP
jgi:hypothetical protein